MESAERFVVGWDVDLPGVFIPLIQAIKMHILSFEMFNQGLTACNTEVNLFVTNEE